MRERPKKKPDSLIAVLILGVSLLIASIPFFLIKTPLLVVHPAYRYVRSGGELIDHNTGLVYGVGIILMGLAVIYLYVRARRNLPQDSPHGHAPPAKDERHFHS